MRHSQLFLSFLSVQMLCGCASNEQKQWLATLGTEVDRVNGSQHGMPAHELTIAVGAPDFDVSSKDFPELLSDRSAGDPEREYTYRASILTKLHKRYVESRPGATWPEDARVWVYDERRFPVPVNRNLGVYTATVFVVRGDTAIFGATIIPWFATRNMPSR